MKFIIEHLEPTLSDWCFIEYNHISDIVGSENLIFSNIKSDAEKEKLQELGEVKFESVIELNLQKVCILDPNAENQLSPVDASFDCLIFGGILGDHPPQNRTEESLTSKLEQESRNLGKEQMSTDTAVLVAKKIIEGKTFSELQFKDTIELDVENPEGIEHTITLPYRYLLENGKPILAKGLAEFLLDKEEF